MLMIGLNCRPNDGMSTKTLLMGVILGQLFGLLTDTIFIFISIFVTTWLPQNLENLYKGPFLGKSMKIRKCQGNLLKKHVCQGNVREQFSVSVCLDGLDTTT